MSQAAAGDGVIVKGYHGGQWTLSATRRGLLHIRRDALAQVKQLHGMLPICAYCKKVRNDRNYWETIESYIGERSAATFSHGICPECRDKVVGPELERWKRSQQGP